MLRRRKPLRIWRILILLVLIGAFTYVNFWVVPVVGPIGVPTSTPTRSPESYLADAASLSKEGKFAQAIESYKQAMIADPNNVNTYIDLARAEIFYTKYDDAKKDAADALLLNNNNATAHATLGWANVFLEDYLSAEASITRAIELDPNNAQAHAYYAELLIAQNNAGQGTIGTVDKASEESKLAIALGPDTMEAHRARGIVYASTGNTDLAIQEFQAAIAISPNIPDLHLQLGVAYRQETNPELDKAVEEFTYANSLNPADPLPDTYIARTYANIGEYTKAVQYAQQAVTDSPSDPYAWGTLGSMLYRSEKFQEAADALRYAVRGGTTTDGAIVKGLALDYGRIVEYYYLYGLALAKTGDCNEAVQISQLLLNGAKDDEIAVYNANAMVNICQGLPADNGQVQDTPVPSDQTAAPADQPTSEPDIASTGTPAN